MARPYQKARVADFLGLNDDLAINAGDMQASTLQNWYKKRRKLVRRNGFAALGSGNLSPDANLTSVNWFKVGGGEHLLATTAAGNITDWLDATTPGVTVANGTARLPNGDVNAAWVEGKVFLGDGTAPNIRYDGGPTGTAAAFSAAANTDYLYVTNTATGIFTGQDITVDVWAYPTSLTGASTFDKVIVSEWDRTTMGNRSWALGYNLGSGRFRFQMQQGGAIQFVDCTSVSVVINTWYHIVARYNAATNFLQIRVNGGTNHTQAWAFGMDEPTTPLRVGGEFLSATTIDEQWTGRIGPIGIWRTAEGGGGCVSDAIATTLYAGGDVLYYADLSDTQKAHLAAWWDMTETSGTRDDATTESTTFNLLVNGSIASAAGAGGALAAATAMCSKAPATFTIGDQAGSVGPGTYSYRVSFVNADGIYAEASNAVTFTTLFQPNNRDITLASIPTAASSEDCIGRMIWRLDPDATDYHLVTFIRDNTTTTYTDTTADISSNDTLVDGNTRMPAFKYLCEHQGRLLGTGNAADPTLFGISNFQEPWYCPIIPDLDDPNQGTQLALQGPAAGAGTGVASHGGVGALFTGGAGFVLIGDQPANFFVHKFCDHGCVAHRTIKSVKSFLIWLAPDGVYLWAGEPKGENVVRISDDIRTTIDALTAAQMAGAHAYVYDDKYFLCWSAGCVWYDLTYKCWGTNTNWLWRDSTVTTYVSDNRQRVYASLEGHARVYQLETTALDAGSTITAVWASRDWDMGLPGNEKRVAYVETKFKKATGTATITLYRGTGESIQTLSHNTATVDNASDTVSRMLQSVVEQARDEHFRLQVSLATTDATCELLAAGLLYKEAL